MSTISNNMFSIDNLLLIENDQEYNKHVVNIDNIGYYDDIHSNDYSFTNEGFAFILEMQRDYNQANKYFYNTILESYGSEEIISEGFSEFWNGIKSIIRKFIDWVKKVCKEFAIKLMGLFKSDKYLKNKKNKDILNKFSDIDEFEYKGFVFTNLEHNYPIAKASENVTKDLSGLLGYNVNYKDDTNNYDKDKADAYLDDQYSKINDSDDFMDNFRGIVIDKSESIYASDYASELFEFFRDDDDTPSDITIDATYVHDAMLRFEKYKDRIKDIEKTQKSIIKDYEKLESILNGLIKSKSIKNKSVVNVSYNNSTSNEYATERINDLTSGNSTVKFDSEEVSKSTVDKMQKIAKALATRTSQMCTIHTQAFSARLQAEKDQYVQDKAILYKALAKVEHKIKEH